MGYKIYSDITCPKRKCYRKYWRSSLLIRNILNAKHHTSYKSIYSKYHIIKILEYCFSWIKLIIPVLIHLKYWFYNFPYLELPCFPHHPCHFLPKPTEAPLQHNHRFPYFVLPIRPHTIKPSQSNLLSSYMQILIPYGSNTIRIKKLSLQELLLFQS